MDKRILIGVALVAMLCVGAWWVVSHAKEPAAPSLQRTDSPAQEVTKAPPTELMATELTSATSTSDSQRATAAEPNAIAATASTVDTALVRVLVLDKSTRNKMSGVKVTSGDTRSGTRTWGEDHGLARGKPWDTLRTDAEGRAEIEDQRRRGGPRTKAMGRARASCSHPLNRRQAGSPPSHPRVVPEHRGTRARDPNIDAQG
jgi:hypothetical protein